MAGHSLKRRILRLLVLAFLLLATGVAGFALYRMWGPYKYPIMLGMIHPGWYRGKAKTEVSALRIGNIEILNIPCEIYPEIVDGGDFLGDPVEVPPLRQEMKGEPNMVFNLANDEVGYLVPKTQWDTEPPHAYDRDEAQYGEENSGGAGTAEVVHRESLAVLRKMHGLLELPDTGSRKAE